LSQRRVPFFRVRGTVDIFHSHFSLLTSFPFPFRLTGTIVGGW
jgi:hypothetical protein